MKKLDLMAFAREAERDITDMEQNALCAYRVELEDKIAWLDQQEPDNEESEAYEVWADAHELLEDLLDEVLDVLES